MPILCVMCTYIYIYIYICIRVCVHAKHIPFFPRWCNTERCLVFQEHFVRERCVNEAMVSDPKADPIVKKPSPVGVGHRNDMKNGHPIR